MLILERQEKIIEYLKAHKSEKTAALARAMYVSEATVRRDIAEMEKLGLVRRSHGGVVLFENSNDEPSIAIRMNEMEAEKQKIARLALPPLKPFPRFQFDGERARQTLSRTAQDGHIHGHTGGHVPFGKGKRGRVFARRVSPLQLQLGGRRDDRAATGKL